MSAPLPTAHKCGCRPSGRTGFIQNDTIYCNKCDGVIAHVEDYSLDELNQLMNEGKKKARKPKLIDTAIKCDPYSSGKGCKAPDHSWFNHSQVGLRGGDYPPGYKGDLDV